MKDESLEIAGFSNDHEPVPLFAHECAGLYEDDEIPGADEHGQSSSSGRDYGDDKEDYDDPTLEKFPSTRDEIISTVRKVETGLNADQVSVEGVPLSPVVHARGSPTTEVRNEPRASEQSPTSRGQQHLSLPPSLEATDERSRSTTSLHSIAEDAEGAESAEEEEPAEPQSEYIADVVEKPNGVDDSAEVDNRTITESSKTSTAEEIAPVVEQAETADEVIETAQEAEGDQSKQIEVANADLPAVVESAPAAEDIASVVEMPSEIGDIASVEDIASVVEKNNGADGAKSTQPDTAQVSGLDNENTLPLDPAEAGKEVALDPKTNDAEPNLAAQKPALESLVTVPSPSVKPDAALLSPVTDDDEAVVVKSTKGEEQSTKSGYLTPERAATPQPEDPGSPREPVPNTADPVAEPVLDSSVPDAEVEAPLTQPRSPQIVVSEPEETRPEEELLPAASLGEAVEDSGHADTKNEASKKDDSPKSEGNVQVSPADGASQVPEPNGAHEESSKDVEVSSENQTPGTIDTSQEAGSLTENTATTSAMEDDQGSTLKKRSVAQPEPVDRTGTPISITDSHKEAAKGGNWFSAFLRLIFIDFFGGFVRKLTGGGRKT